jgi:lipopolysaccharide/colanic/teichoic acid biosynthesis glycosyltransferase
LPNRDVQRFTEAALMRRFSVRPGITCTWQVSGRSNLGFEDWIALDLRYIDQWSLGLDLLILLRTIPAVLKGTGAA